MFGSFTKAHFGLVSDLTLVSYGVAEAVAADPETGLALEQMQAQGAHHTPPGAAPAEASGALQLCRLAAAESCCASLPVQLQQDMMWGVSPTCPMA